MHFSALKTVDNQKSVNLGMISARHTSNRQSFKKVTCPFNIKHCISGRDSKTVNQTQKAEVLRLQDRVGQLRQ